MIPTERPVAFLAAMGAGQVAHSGRTLLDHLLGTHALLVTWGRPEAVSLAGLFHSVYGTTSYEPVLVPLDNRTKARAVIGTDAEQLVWLFSRCSPHLLAEAVRDPAAVLLDPNGEPLPATAGQIQDLAWIALANLNEQHPHLGGWSDDLVDELSAALDKAVEGTHQSRD